MNAARRAFRFAGYTLDLTRGRLRTADRPIELRPKSYAVLAYLVENAGRLVSKEELMKAVWPDVIVTDDSLARCVSDVRAALADSEQCLVKTVPRRGYLFDVPVSEADGSCDPSSSVLADALDAATAKRSERTANWLPVGTAKRSRHLLIGFGVALLLISITLALALFHRMQSTSPQASDRASIAVIPFSNDGDPGQGYFSDGLIEDLIASLGRFSGLFVIGPDSAFAYGARHVPAQQAGRELGVRYLLEGSVRRDGNRVRVTAELIEAATGRQLWVESYDRALTAIFAVQDELTQKIVGTLVPHVDRVELARALRTPSARLTAYDYYLRGKALTTMRHGDNRGEMVAEARRLFGRAVAADPSYAPAVQGLAYTYAATFLEPMRDGLFAGEYRQQATLDRALSLAQQAVELDPYLAEAHATLAWILHWQYRRGEAISEFERALELNPNLSDGRLAHMLVLDGRAGEAVEYMRRVMRQDPFPPPIYLSYLGNAYYLIGRYEAAFETLRRGAGLMPGYRAIEVWLAAAAAQSGRQDEARKAAAMVASMSPDFTIHRWMSHIRLERQGDADRLAEGLRKAGLPE